MKGNGTVLVVDDDDDIRDFMEIALREAGYRVLSADNGSTALHLLAQSPSDLILLDMRMPVMDGWTFARTYRERPWPHAPIVAISAGDEARRRAAEIGAAAYLSKPFGLGELTRLVDGFFHD